MTGHSKGADFGKVRAGVWLRMEGRFSIWAKQVHLKLGVEERLGPAGEFRPVRTRSGPRDEKASARVHAMTLHQKCAFGRQKRAVHQLLVHLAILRGVEPFKSPGSL